MSITRSGVARVIVVRRDVERPRIPAHNFPTVRSEEMPMLELTVNGRRRRVDVEPEMPLLFVLRDHLDLRGAKYGCGVGLCGACTVHVDGQAVRACTLPAKAAVGKKIVTIEGLSASGIHRVQKAWIEHEVPQCGYCQTGMIMTAVA